MLMFFISKLVESSGGSYEKFIIIFYGGPYGNHDFHSLLQKGGMG
jgi:hypothetical protein